MVYIILLVKPCDLWCEKLIQADVAAFKDFKDDSTGAPAKPAEKKQSAAAAPPPAAPAVAAPAPAAPKPAAPTPAAAAAPAGQQHGRIYASPMARRLAEIKSIRLGGQGSGLYGSLKSGDLAAAAAATASLPPPPAPAPGATFTDIPLSGMRETIAKRLSAAKQTIPHYQLCATVNVEKLLAMRKEVNERLAAEKSNVKVSVNDFILKAVAAACKRVPTVNSHWMETFIRQYSNVDVSVAVATPSGLITPIIFNADSRGILDISNNMKELANKAKEGRLQPQEYQGGTVTVSNLGMFGITMFNAIINPPQSLILACGGLQDIVIPDKNEPQGYMKLFKIISILYLGVSVNDFILKAVAAACKRVPTVNSHWMETFIRQYSNVDVSVAVATPSGLITPIIFNADSRGILDISNNMKELANKAKEGRLQPQEYQGGTVTVSNLGMFGITMFNAIINPPQSLILACGGLQDIVIPDKNEPQGFRLAKFVTFTASADHRVIDGAVGAQWMKVLKENLENPANIILCVRKEMAGASTKSRTSCHTPEVV
ncbi:jg14040 [Pararge aegeria aegeria]|uniref:Jg14040 protein n=1 Tax=Pararge aegeria aegeria TaxID=348720 RepID=A0A8S4R4G7_9NEOP|nr:jg14040 [Pararge aegeria aegeria]